MQNGVITTRWCMIKKTRPLVWWNHWKNISVNRTLNAPVFPEAKIKNVPYWCCVVWQCACGKNILATKMRTLSQSVGCSQIYTNHCVRATAKTIFSRAGIKDRDICSVSGHPRVDSLNAYRSKPTTEKRQEMSAMLHKYSSGTPASDLSTSLRPLSDVQMPPADVEVRPKTCEPSSTQVNESVSLSVPSSMR